MEDTQNPQSGQPVNPPSDQGGTPPTPPPSGQGAQPAGGAQPPKDQKDLSGIMEENVDISSLVANASNKEEQEKFITSVKVPEHPNTKFDESKFLQLLAGSISLTANEKKRIVEAIPQLSQFQIDELIKIFSEEQQKFSELEKKHADQVAELEKQHKESWQDVEAKAEEEDKKKKEEQEAEDIKKSLGL